MAAAKRQDKVELDSLASAKKSWKNDDVLKEVFRVGSKPKVRVEWLEREIPRLRDDIAKFQVAENYRVLELEAEKLTLELRDFEKQAAVLRFQIASIEKSLIHHPDISKADLLGLYEGLETIFQPAALEHFTAVESFHKDLQANRQVRLEADKHMLVSRLEVVNKELNATAQNRDTQLQLLQGKRALDDYVSIARHLANLEEERKRLADFLNLSAKIQEKEQVIRERQIEKDRLTTTYVATKPDAEVDNYFRTLAEIMYPRVPSGIVLDSNTGSNQIRFDLTIQIEGQDSDGINAARILCFDWLLLTHGKHHNINFLWHDNRLFADIDPAARAKWFNHVNSTLKGTGKQYIATINTENYQAMKPHLDAASWDELESSVALILTGDNASNKLLGVQFGGEY